MPPKPTQTYAIYEEKQLAESVQLLQTEVAKVRLEHQQQMIELRAEYKQQLDTILAIMTKMKGQWNAAGSVTCSSFSQAPPFISRESPAIHKTQTLTPPLTQPSPPETTSYNNSRTPSPKIQQKMKAQAEKDENFERGDLVLLKLRAYRQHFVHQRQSQKSSCRDYGPFHLLCCNEMVTYELDLPEYLRIHPIFPVSLPRTDTGPPSAPLAPLTPLDVDDRHTLFTASIIAQITIWRNGVQIEQALVQWSGSNLKDVSWVYWEPLILDYPILDNLDAHGCPPPPTTENNQTPIGLEDKANLENRGIDTSLSPWPT